MKQTSQAYLKVALLMCRLFQELFVFVQKKQLVGGKETTHGPIGELSTQLNYQ